MGNVHMYMLCNICTNMKEITLKKKTLLSRNKSWTISTETDI